MERRSGRKVQFKGELKANLSQYAVVASYAKASWARSTVFGSPVADPERYGVADFDEAGPGPQHH